MSRVVDGLRGTLPALAVRARLLCLVLVAAASFTAVAAVASVSAQRVAGLAAEEHRAVELAAQHLRCDTLMAELHGQVYEVVVAHQRASGAAESLAEYREVKGALEDLVAEIARDAPEGEVATAAAQVADGVRAVVTAGDTTVSRTTDDPAGARPQLARLDDLADSVDGPLDALITRLEESQERAQASTSQARRQSTTAVVAAATAGVVLLFALALVASSSILRGLRQVAAAAGALAQGDFGVRFDDPRRDEIGMLGAAFNATADSVRTMVHDLERQRARDTFGRQLNEALEVADTEEQTYDVLRRALPLVSAHPTELLVADSSRAHLNSQVEHPQAGAPGCRVQSPFDCLAVRRGTTTAFGDSEALNACPELRGRGSGPLSAVCVPVTFMGRALGVLHTASPVDAPPGSEVATDLATLASATGARIGTVRSYAQTQLQASTDGLTGLLNRRAFETHVRPLLRSSAPCTLVMADVDHFKRLNDTLGHQSGDRALALLTGQLRSCVRDDDVVARYGGEEFVVFLPACTSADAVELFDRFRDRLAAATATQPPAFTVSFGVAQAQEGDSLDDLIRRADAALYRAKTEGRDRVVADRPGGTAVPRQVVPAALRRIEDDPLADALPRR